MELPKLIDGLPTQAPVNGASVGGQPQVGGGQRDGKAAQLLKSAKTLNQDAVQLYKDQQIDYKFRLNPSLFEALDKAIDYMNRTLQRDGLEMALKQNEEGEPIAAQVVDQAQDGKVVKEYDVQDVLRYYAHSGYGAGVVVDGKI